MYLYNSAIREERIAPFSEVPAGSVIRTKDTKQIFFVAQHGGWRMAFPFLKDGTIQSSDIDLAMTPHPANTVHVMDYRKLGIPVRKGSFVVAPRPRDAEPA